MTRFDRLFAEAAPLVHQRVHQRDTPPVDGGRWPLSVVLRPDQTSAERLEQTMAEAELYAGSGHFRTGIAGSVHFAADIAQPARLVEWVEERRQLNLGRIVLDTAELWRFRYENGANGRLMRPEVLATARTRSPG